MMKLNEIDNKQQPAAQQIEKKHMHTKTTAMKQLCWKWFIVLKNTQFLYIHLN